MSPPLLEVRPWISVLGIVALALSLSLLQDSFMRADAVSYFSYLRSLAFDRDLDFTNEWAHWGYDPTPLTPTGLRTNVHSIGPALLWSPFFVVAHLFVLVAGKLGVAQYSADGFSVPYWRAAGIGTLFVALSGCLLLFSALARTYGRWIAATCVAVASLSSFIVYYIIVLPTMAHGLAFGVAAAGLWAMDRVALEPSRRNWVILGVLCGLLCLVRWQAAVFLLMPAALGVAQLLRRRITLGPLLLASAAAIAVFVPQLVAWRILYGRFVTLPQGAGFIDWTSPHLVDVLLSADHGLFTWSPIAVLGVVGLLVLTRSQALLGWSGLAVVLVNAWVCGGVRDWAASDAFGARRFDFVVPILALGLAAGAHALVSLVRAKPALVPVLLGLVFVVWNLAFLRGFQRGALQPTASLERASLTQVTMARDALETILGWIGGERGRALAYKTTVGEYFYGNVNPSGSIEVGAINSPYLLNGWSKVRIRNDGPQFRWALAPAACVRIPLERPFALRGFVTARSVSPTASSAMNLSVNGHPVSSSVLGAKWSDHPFVVPENILHSGENQLCLSAPGQSESDVSKAMAAVALIQLP